jgi:hypothetical protein
MSWWFGLLSYNHFHISHFVPSNRGMQCIVLQVGSLSKSRDDSSREGMVVLDCVFGSSLVDRLGATFVVLRDAVVANVHGAPAAVVADVLVRRGGFLLSNAAGVFLYKGCVGGSMRGAGGGMVVVVDRRKYDVVGAVG